MENNKIKLKNFIFPPLHLNFIMSALYENLAKFGYAVEQAACPCIWACLPHTWRSIVLARLCAWACLLCRCTMHTHAHAHGCTCFALGAVLSSHAHVHGRACFVPGAVCACTPMYMGVPALAQNRVG